MEQYDSKIEILFVTFITFILVLTELLWQIENQGALKYAEMVPTENEVVVVKMHDYRKRATNRNDISDSSFLVLENEEENEEESKEEEQVIACGGNITAPKYYMEAEDDLYLGYSEEDIDLLAACVYFEAGNQSMEGKRLVVDVILNRCESDRFPDSIRGVLSAPGQFVTYNRIVSCSYDDVPIDCYGAVLAEIEARNNGIKLDENLYGYNVYFFSSNGSENVFRNGGI